MQNFITLIDEDSEPGMIYIGKSIPGSWENSEVWSIKKIDTTWIMSIKFAHGSASYIHKWSERLSLSYS